MNVGLLLMNNNKTAEEILWSSLKESKVKYNSFICNDVKVESSGFK